MKAMGHKCYDIIMQKWVPVTPINLTYKSIIIRNNNIIKFINAQT